MTLREYLDLGTQTYLEPDKAPNTVRAYRYALAHLSPAVQGMELGAVTPLHLQREINALAARYSRQAQIMYTGLNSAYRKAAKLGMVGENPMGKVDKPGHEKREICYLWPEEAAAYVREAEREPAGRLLVLMLVLGLRRNEARGLRCGDLDEHGILHVEHQRARDGLAPLKSRSSRRPLPVPEALRPFFDGPTGQWVADVSEKSLRTQHLRVLSRIGVSRAVTLHGLRHTCATIAIMGGAELVTVQKLLGHKHEALTADLYVHADVEILRPCINVLSGIFLSHSVQEGARLEIV